MLKFVFVTFIGLTISISEGQETCLEETCDTKQCGPFETCTTCGINFCNTYSCSNPAGMLCKPSCIKSPPTCICQPNYHRKTPGAPCTRLKCPTSSDETCDTKKCGRFEMCTNCRPNVCNTHTCADPGGTVCKIACMMSPPTCVCKPYYHRRTPGAPCTRLKCPTTPPKTCDTIKCGRNEVCAPCGQSGCNTYDCNNKDGSLVDCINECKEPACVCKPFFHRLSANGPCVPLICPDED